MSLHPVHVGYREDERSFPFRGSGPSSPRLHSTLPALPLPFPPSFLPEGSLNWHRFRTAPDSKLLPKCFHFATLVAALRSLRADRLRAKLFHEAAVARDVGFAFRGARGFSRFFKCESQRLGGLSASVEWRCNASQSDGCSEQKSCACLGAGQKRPLFEGPISRARADASESPCGRI